MCGLVYLGLFLTSVAIVLRKSAYEDAASFEPNVLLSAMNAYDEQQLATKSDGGQDEDDSERLLVRTIHVFD